MSKRSRDARAAHLVRYYQSVGHPRAVARGKAHATLSARGGFSRWLDLWPGRARCVSCEQLRYTVIGGGCAACRRLYG